MKRFTGASLALSLSLAVGVAGAGTLPAHAKSNEGSGEKKQASQPTVERVTPIPEITQLPITDESYPFGAADHQLVPEDLPDQGYVEEEYLASGNANVYTWPAPGPAVIRTEDAPYTTRVLVRKPAKGQHFSGNVVVEMLNPSNLFDLNIGWAVAHEQIVNNGDAWVGITAKPIAVDALKNFDAERYGSLSYANPLSLDDPQNCLTVAADSARTTENGLVWDIYSQVGAWLKSDTSSNPLAYGGDSALVEKAYGLGYSQTGGYLANYINGVQPHVIESDGAPIYDGYIVGVAGGAFAGAYPMNQCESAPAADDPRRQFQDVGVPIIRMMSQSDYLAGIGSRRADSDEPGDRYRHYEMAGAGHATPDELYFSATSEDIVAAGRTVPPMSCNEGPRSRFPSSIFFNAALQNLDLWVRDGVAPPRAEPILVENGAPVLDEFGNVQGGLRSPYLDVPTSTWYGTATGASFCFIAGYERPLDDETIAGLYPTHRSYVKAVKDNAKDLEDQRFLTKEDVRKLRKEAAQADIP
ncbi:alpha/beta hydrolase domain-containing protein [Arthrobacter sp. Br18]|uniref:alpha/beta hydrolase domain-containing protein n=1 Tax=Arthrobacter sp. Br18 TaxID=1312954 RepID=UPI00047CC30F|nr:alpha/beta hydrolase domain-containing protein [Arthrobacter sp. Br18]